MTRPIIEVDRLSKRYRLGLVGATTLRDDLARIWRSLRGAPAAAQTGEFWALRDVSFKVSPGEVIGLIGRNGAGKSTLLKILSRITEPTSGRAILRGRVTSLLEVGTGFHPDLTGRENVFLNGAILGMKEKEIAARFDEIVAFAEVEPFIDTPVKHYSSGMRVRLAFAVAAHLEAEILIIDEVLAVGDAAFQQRCLQRMDKLAHQRARTVLLVTHQLEMIRRLAERCILLEAGGIVFDGAPMEAIALHSARAVAQATAQLPPAEENSPASITAVSVHDPRGDNVGSFPVGAPWRATVDIDVRRPMPTATLGLGIRTGDGIWLRTGWTTTQNLVAGRVRVTFDSGVWRLAPGRYYFAIGLSAGTRVLHYLEDIAGLTVGPTAIDSVAVRLEGVGIILDPWETAWTPLVASGERKGDRS